MATIISASEVTVRYNNGTVLGALSLPTGAKLAYDIGKNPVVLFQNEWSANYFNEMNKSYPLSAQPVQTARE